MISFDREAPGGGVDAYTVTENSKAEIIFTVYLKQASEGDVQVQGGEHTQAAVQTVESARPQEKLQVELFLYDPNGQEAARMCVKTMPQEEACWTVNTRTLLIYPRMWQGTLVPVLYQVEALITNGEKQLDALRFVYPICTMRQVEGTDFLLNDRPYTLHAVKYGIPRADGCLSMEKFAADLEIMQELGANCICPDHFPTEPQFYELCLKKGMILWKLTGEAEEIPLFCGGEKALMSDDGRRKRDSFYLYQACWSNGKVLHICHNRQVPRPGSLASVMVYSNQKKVALYVNGVLQEFKESSPRFLFEDIPVRGEYTIVSAQAGDCFASVTWNI